MTGKLFSITVIISAIILVFSACSEKSSGPSEQPGVPGQPMAISADVAEAEYWNKEIPLLTPKKSNGKLVLFDVSHISTGGDSDWVIDGAFSDFADALVKEGYTVKEYRGIDNITT